MHLRLTFSFLFFASFLFSQKVLKLDTRKTPSKMAFYVCSEIIFKLDDVKNNDIWFIERITDFDVDKGILYFETWQVQFQDIIAVRNPNATRFMKTAAVSLKTFGAGLIFFSTAGRLSPNCENCDGALVVGVSVGLLGFILDWISPTRVYKIGEKNKLRMLNLTPKPNNLPAKV